LQVRLLGNSLLLEFKSNKAEERKCGMKLSI
jgi:hypothetical protein